MSENNEEIETYAAQDLEMLNTKEATTEFWPKDLRSLKVRKVMRNDRCNNVLPTTNLSLFRYLHERKE